MLSAHETIKEKQIQWARNRDINLIGSKGERGVPAYTSKLKENLFDSLLDSVRDNFDKGNGNEIAGDSKKPVKMQAVHSSSALSVNVFQYWESIHQVPVIAAACGFCDQGDVFSEEIVFEKKCYIDGIIGGPPNIDVLIQNSDASPYHCFAIESKFAEPYDAYSKVGLNPAYLKVDGLWVELPNLHEFARSISPENHLNTYFDSAQLVRHILGLKSCYGMGFKLLYLWYDALGEAGAVHRAEIDNFTEIAQDDGIHFSSLTYQELIVWLARECREKHPEYVRYLTERYL